MFSPTPPSVPLFHCLFLQKRSVEKSCVWQPRNLKAQQSITKILKCRPCVTSGTFLQHIPETWDKQVCFAMLEVAPNAKISRNIGGTHQNMHSWQCGYMVLCFKAMQHSLACRKKLPRYAKFCPNLTSHDTSKQIIEKTRESLRYQNNGL